MITIVCLTNYICEYIYYMSVNKARYDALLMKKMKVIPWVRTFSGTKLFYRGCCKSNFKILIETTFSIRHNDKENSQRIMFAYDLKLRNSFLGRKFLSIIFFVSQTPILACL